MAQVFVPRTARDLHKHLRLTPILGTDPLDRIQQAGAGGCRVPEVPIDSWFPDRLDPRRHMSVDMVIAFIHAREEHEFDAEAGVGCHSLMAAVGSIFEGRHRGSADTLDLFLAYMGAIRDFYHELRRVEVMKYPCKVLPPRGSETRLDHAARVYPVLDEVDKEKLRPFVLKIMIDYYAMVNTRTDLKRLVTDHMLAYTVYLLTYLRPF